MHTCKKKKFKSFFQYEKKKKNQTKVNRIDYILSIQIVYINETINLKVLFSCKFPFKIT